MVGEKFRIFGLSPLSRVQKETPSCLVMPNPLSLGRCWRGSSGGRRGVGVPVGKVEGGIKGCIPTYKGMPLYIMGVAQN